MNRMMNDEKCNEHGRRSFAENGIIIGGEAIKSKEYDIICA